MIIFIIFQIFIGYLYATWLEWAIHKYVLHGLGKKKGNFIPKLVKMLLESNESEGVAAS